jgi:hypothetical protein
MNEENIKDHNSLSILQTGVNVWFLNLQTSRQTCSPTGAPDAGTLA